MADFLDLLVEDALKTVESGYYYIGTEPRLGTGNDNGTKKGRGPEKGTAAVAVVAMEDGAGKKAGKEAGDESARRRVRLKESITKCRHAPIIAEIKPASPSHGILRPIEGLREIARAMEAGGASGISVLTEPKHFKGSIKALAELKGLGHGLGLRLLNLPVLMKDIIVSPIQIEAAANLGADAILLLFSVFERGYTSHSVEDMIKLARSRGLEVLLEVHTKREFLDALETEADLVGINNRDLKTLKVNLDVTRRILWGISECGKIVVSESGIQTPDDVRFLRSCGARAFLVGSAIMKAPNIEGKVRELVMAL